VLGSSPFAGIAVRAAAAARNKVDGVPPAEQLVAVLRAIDAGTLRPAQARAEAAAPVEELEPARAVTSAP
jgi:hypothetical protein